MKDRHITNHQTNHSRGKLRMQKVKDNCKEILNLVSLVSKKTEE